jgi:thioredoxin-related protein
MSQFNSIEFKEIDVDEDTDDLSGKYGVRGVPSVILLDNDNKVLERLTGTQSEQKFVEVLSKHI